MQSIPKNRFLIFVALFFVSLFVNQFQFSLVPLLPVRSFIAIFEINFPRFMTVVNLLSKLFLTCLLITACNRIIAQDRTAITSYIATLAQAKDDTSKINALVKLAKAYTDVQCDTALLHVAKAIQLAQKLNNPSFLGKAHQAAGYIRSTCDYDNAVSEYEKALGYWRAAGDHEHIFSALFSIGCIKDNIDSAGSSLSYFQQAISEANILNDSARLIMCLYQVAEASEIINDDSARLAYLQQLVETMPANAQHIVEADAFILMMKANIASLKNNDDSAIFFTQAILSKPGETDTDDAAHMMLGKLLFKRKDYVAAIGHFKTARAGAVSEPLLMAAQLSRYETNIAASYLALKNYDSALAYGLKSIAPAITSDNFNSLTGAYKTLSEIYYATGNYRAAYQYRLTADSIEQLDRDAKQQEVIASLHTQFETEKKDKQNQLLQRQNQVTHAQLQRNQALLITAIVSLLLLVLLYRNYRQRQQSRMLQVRDKIAKDLHDDIGASLSSIRMYSEAVRMQVQSPQAGEMLQRISDNSKEIVENMSDIVWAINPKNDSLQFMEDRMHAFVSSVCSSKDIVPHFKRVDFHELKLPMEVRKNIFLVFKEAVNNAAKYAACNNIFINMEKKNGRFEMSIADDGKGFDTASANHGNGLTNMRKRAEELKGNIDIESRQGRGTTIRFSFPLP